MDAADQLKANLATLDRMRLELAQEHAELTQRDRIARVLAANDGLCMDSEDDRATLLEAICAAL